MERKVKYSVTVESETCTTEDVEWAIEKARFAGADLSAGIQTYEVTHRLGHRIQITWDGAHENPGGGE